MIYVLITCLLMVGLSSLPDLDITWEIKHRGITHTFLFGIIFGILFAVLIGYAYGVIGWIMGFISGFGGTASHLLGDAFTITSFKPFLPFSQKEIGGYGFFRSSNRSVNRTIFVLGVIAFIVSYEPSVVSQIISSISLLL
ncbi:MAG: metal-dependent hydrolase [Candidatus Bathyarchaeia archaeon]